MVVRVLVVDDHGVVRQGLRMYLSLDRTIAVVGEAADGAEAVALASALRPDVVLMDLLMPRMDGTAATRAIRNELPDVEVVALTSMLEDGAVSEAVKAGAIGYLLKDARAEELCRAVHGAAAGEVQLSPAAASKLMRELRTPDLTEALTDRETEVLRRLAQGEANKQIATALSIAEKTVKAHVSSILRKLGATSRTQAALYAVRSGLVRMEELREGPGQREEQA